jgi:hypothetical protein
MLTLIALIAAVTFIRSIDGPLNAEEHSVSLEAAALAPDLQAE